MYIQKLKIRSIGNSQGIILPKNVIESLNLAVGSEVDLIVEDGSFSVSSSAPSLDALLASVPEGESFVEVSAGKSSGVEE